MKRLVARLLLLCAVIATSAKAQGLPDRLSDAEFWRLTTSVSEPTGTFPSENFVSNEVGYQWVIPDLLKEHKPGGVYLGVGPEQNFSYIAALQPKIAFIVDIRRQALLQHLVYKMVFELTDNRADFLSLLFSRPKPKGLGANMTPQALFAAYDSVAADSMMYVGTLGIIKNRLTKTHGFTLSDEDLAGIEHVFAVIYRYGPHLSYSSRVGGFPVSGGPGGIAFSSASPVSGPIRMIRTTPAPNGVDVKVDTTILNPVLLSNGKIDSTPTITVHLSTGSAIGQSTLIAPTFGSLPGARNGCDLIAVNGVAVQRDTSLRCPAPLNQLGYLVGPGTGAAYRGGVDYSSLMAASDSAGEQRSFLANEANYGRVRDLERRNMLVPVVGNFSGPTALRGVGQYLKDHHATVTAIYTSNVEEYLFRNPLDWQGYYSNVATLPVDGASTFIRSIRNPTPVGRDFPMFGGGYVTALGSISDLLAAFAAGRIHGYADLYSFIRH